MRVEKHSRDVVKLGVLLIFLICAGFSKTGKHAPPHLFFDCCLKLTLTTPDISAFGGFTVFR